MQHHSRERRDESQQRLPHSDGIPTSVGFNNMARKIQKKKL
jgi:hypothetical protein